MFGVGGNEYGQCGEEPERKDDTGKPLRRDIVIPQRCAPKLVVRQVYTFYAIIHVFSNETRYDRVSFGCSVYFLPVITSVDISCLGLVFKAIYFSLDCIYG